jgi:hypothetical protein
MSDLEQAVPSAAAPYVRTRLDTLLDRAISTVEREGVAVNGAPHPMLAIIATLASAGTEIRSLALDRKIYADDLEKRPAQR